MNQELFDWLLMLVRWLHITVGVTWIGTSIFFMWLDRSFEVDPDSAKPGHIGKLWMVHGGGFYHVEKLQMGPTKVPDHLHWFKWESYWTWISGMILLGMIFYTGEGTFLLDDSVSGIGFYSAIMLSLFSIFGSWFFYDFLWELKITRQKAFIGHILTITWLIVITYILCKTISGRAAYIHIGAMLGTWMAANVFMRIIPRQVKMVEASKRGEEVNQEWGKNAKNRSTHNTYFTLPVIFIMLSNHFPQTYGHEYNWLILFILCGAGAAIREYFVKRLTHPARSMSFALLGLILLFIAYGFSLSEVSSQTERYRSDHSHEMQTTKKAKSEAPTEKSVKHQSKQQSEQTLTLSGEIKFEGEKYQGKKLKLPKGCNNPSTDLYSDEVIVSQGKLKNVLVKITAGHENLDFGKTPDYAVELDQVGCIYTPRIIGVRIGQPVEFINSDTIFHNVKSVTKNNRSFNLAMPRHNQRERRVFDKEEIVLQTKCSVHPWMSANIAVVSHPFFAISDELGKFQISNLAEGIYTVETWHEVFGKLKAQVELKANQVNKIDFSYK